MRGAVGKICQPRGKPSGRRDGGTAVGVSFGKFCKFCQGRTYVCQVLSSTGLKRPAWFASFFLPPLAGSMSFKNVRQPDIEMSEPQASRCFLFQPRKGHFQETHTHTHEYWHLESEHFGVPAIYTNCSLARPVFSNSYYKVPRSQSTVCQRWDFTCGWVGGGRGSTVLVTCKPSYDTSAAVCQHGAIARIFTEVVAYFHAHCYQR